MLHSPFLSWCSSKSTERERKSQRGKADSRRSNKMYLFGTPFEGMEAGVTVIVKFPEQIFMNSERCSRHSDGDNPFAF